VDDHRFVVSGLLSRRVVLLVSSYLSRRIVAITWPSPD
jgi:hypothetical protein